MNDPQSPSSSTSSNPPTTVTPRKRQRRSWVWDHFRIIESKVNCQHCRAQYSKNISTHNLIAHMRNHHSSEIEANKSPGDDDDDDDVVLTNFIVTSDSSLSIMRNKWIRGGSSHVVRQRWHRGSRIRQRR